MKRFPTPRAFTLIELLIVVAIIAILAAIAVPNFLEAQVRAKVSRVKSDHRTIATSLEAYYVDNNQYVEQGDTTNPGDPPTIRDTTRVWGREGQRAIAFRLSTPIAYLSSTQSVFADPFFSGFGKASVVNDTRYYNYSGDYARGRTYDSTQDGSTANFLALSDILGQINGWHLRSRGPDTDYERRSDGWADYILYRGRAGAGTTGDGGLGARYDATNGTVSGGDIARFGREGLPQ
jgi:prepilin-type N-terminal cleavage/methylation domain-containing protein